MAMSNTAAFCMAKSLLLGCLIIATTGGCSTDEPGKPLRKVTLKTGESQDFSITTPGNMRVGILCLSEPDGGNINLSQKGGGSLSASFWGSMLWVPQNGQLDFRLTNNAKNDVSIVVFRGKAPSKALLSSCHGGKKRSSCKSGIGFAGKTPPVASWLTLDGLATEWQDIKPVLKEMGLAGHGASAGHDIKQAYLHSDRGYLYLFARTEPSVVEQFKKRPSSRGMFDLFLDSDCRKDTGSKNRKATWLEGLPGTDRIISVIVGWTGSPTKGTVRPFVDVQVSRRDRDGVDSGIIWTGSSEGPKPAVAHGKDGVEAAIPLDVLGLKSGCTVPVLFSEGSHVDAIQKVSIVIAPEPNNTLPPK